MLDEYRLPVTEQGVILPKVWFGQAKEVVVRSENGHLKLETVESPPQPIAASQVDQSNSPSIWDLGSDPIMDDPITDSSTNHDQYLYGQRS